MHQCQSFTCQNCGGKDIPVQYGGLAIPYTVTPATTGSGKTPQTINQSDFPDSTDFGTWSCPSVQGAFDPPTWNVLSGH